MDAKRFTNSGAAQAAGRYVRAVLIERSAAVTDESNALVDPFDKFYLEGLAITPPHPMESMSVLPQYSETLWPVIDAIATNIERTGYSLVKSDTDLDDEDPAVAEDYQNASDFIDGCVMGAQGSLEDQRVQWRWDLESTGCGYIEVMRSKETGLPMWIQHLPSFTMRLVKADATPTLCDAYKRGPDGRWQVVKLRKRFRRFLQLVDGNQAAAIWFKEFGDPRDMDRRTGKYGKVADGFAATDVIFRRHYAPNTPYGVSPFAGALPAVAGSRMADEMNLAYFENPLPPVIIMVSGGSLTPDSLELYKNAFKERKGKDPWQALLLEATPEESAAPAASQLLGANQLSNQNVKIAIERLTLGVEQDALFTKYKAANQIDIRCMRRVPAVVLGRTEDYNRATAGAGLQMFESQVCVHGRKVFDGVVNDELFPVLGISFYEFRSNAASFTDPADMAAMAQVAIQAGVGDIDTWASVFEPLFGIEFPRNDAWKGIPFQMLLTLVQQGMVDANAAGDTAGAETMGEDLLTQMAGGEAPTPEARQAMAVVQLILRAKGTAERMGLVGSTKRAKSPAA